MTMRKCHQLTKTCDVNRCVPARNEVVSSYVFLLLLLLLNFGVFSTNAQWQREQIVFVSQEADLQQIRLTNGILSYPLKLPPSFRQLIIFKLGVTQLRANRL